MSRRKCCCKERDCLIAEDDFNRADNNDPGDTWVEVGGSSDWDILDNRLICETEGPLITTHRQGLPLRFIDGVRADYNVEISFTLRDIGDPGVDPDNVDDFGVICGFIDPDDFYWVRFVYDPVEELIWPYLMLRTAGSDSVVMSKDTHPDGVGFSPDTATTWDGRICFAVEDWTVYHGTQTPTTDDRWTVCGGGLADLPDGFVNNGEWFLPGMVGFLRGNFDDWSFEEHWESNINCDRCSCFCRHPDDDDDFTCYPEALYATITPDPGNTGYCLATSHTIKLIQSEPDDPDWLLANYDKIPTKRFWSSLHPDGSPGDPFKFNFICSDGGEAGDGEGLGVMRPKGVAHITGGNWVPVPDFNAFGLAEPDWSLSTCEPLYLVWPGQVQSGQVDCPFDNEQGYVTCNQICEAFDGGVGCEHLEGCVEDGGSSMDGDSWTVVITK